MKMLVCKDEKHKRAQSFIAQAEKYYLDIEVPLEKNAEAICKEAIELLESCEDGLSTWILICNSKALLFLAILKNLRLLHIERDPLNASADLFDPILPRDYFEPKPPDKLCPRDFRQGFDRLRSVRRQFYDVWHEKIVPHYSSLTTAAEKMAVVKTTVKLMIISLLGSSHPFDALEPCYYVCQWSRHSAAYRWLSTLLIGLGFPKTAAKFFASLPPTTTVDNKSATTSIIHQAMRMANLVDGKVAENVDEDITKAYESARRRLASITALVDCYAIQQLPETSVSNLGTLGMATSRARLMAFKSFYCQNKMDTSATVDMDDTQNVLNLFWYLQTLLTDALTMRRFGRSRMCEKLLKEGFSVASVLCAPYWILEFATHLAQLHVLCNTIDQVDTEKLIFVQKVFMDIAHSPKVDLRQPPNEDAMYRVRKKELNPAKTNAVAVTAVELSRRAEVTKDAKAKSSRIPRSIQNGRIANNDPKSNSNRDCTASTPDRDLNVSIFQTMVTNLTSTNPAKLTTECMDFLRSKNWTTSSYICSCRNVPNAFIVDDEDFCTYANGSKWALLDFCLLSAMKSNGVESFNCDDIRIVKKALDMLPSSNVSSFSLYYRLTFEYLVTVLEYGRRTDICHTMRDLHLSDGAETTRTRTRADGAKTTTMIQRSSSNDLRKLAIIPILERLKKYGHLPFFPWYRLMRQFVGSFYLLSNAQSTVLSTKYDWQTLVASNLLESTALSFRYVFNEKLRSSNDVLDGQLRGLADGEALKDALSTLPQDWTIISLHVLQMSSHRRVVLCRLSRRYQPIVVDLGNAFSKFDAVEEFASLIRDIEASIKEKKDDKRAYWDKRFELDTKLQVLLERLESSWFGYKRALFRGYSEELQNELFKRGAGAFNDRDLEILLTATGVINDTERRQYANDMLRLTAEQLKRFLTLAKGPVSGIENTGPVFLILDTELHSIPWENMPILRDRPVCRIPCLQYLVRSIAKWRLPKTISNERVFYVVNPAGDLNMVEDYFNWFPKIHGWHGFKKQPILGTMEVALAKNDVHIYCGHGPSVECLHSLTKVEQLSCNAVAVLMGCSSAKLANRGPVFEAEGHPLSYLIAQSPCAIGCLWGVTSPDIDKFLARVLKVWLKACPPEALITISKEKQIGLLLSAIAQSGSACKLRYLTAASVVSYGLPIFCNEPVRWIE